MPKYKEQLKIELSYENPTIGLGYFYATLNLPATDYEIRDAIQRARGINSKEGYSGISIVSCANLPELTDIRLDTATIQEINFFAKRLDTLSEEEKVILQALLQQRYQNGKYEDGISMKELINLTYDLDNVMIASNITNDTELGRFVIENELNDDINSIPQTALYLLDKSQIGQMQREIDGGVYIDNYYICTGNYEDQEVYDGEHLPQTTEDTYWVFRLKTYDRNKEISTIELPIGFEEAEKIKEELSNHKAVINECDSIIPQIDFKLIDNSFNICTLNQLAYRIKNMSEQEQIKFKAVIETENIQNLDTALDIADHIAKYELAYYCCDEDDFMKSYLTHHLPTNFDPLWINDIVCDTTSCSLIKKLNAKVSSYGIISARGQSLYNLVSYADQISMNEEMEVVEVLGEKALFSNERISSRQIPEGLYRYELREGENIPFASVENSVAVNHSGTVLTKAPLDFGGKTYIAFDEDSSPNFLGYYTTIKDFLDEKITHEKGLIL